MKRLFLILLLLALPSVVRAQTITPQLVLNTTDSPATMATFVATLQIGTGTVTQVTPVCVVAGTGAICTITGFTFDATKPTTFTVVLVNPSNGRTANGTANYAPGQPPGSFTLVPGWKVTLP